MFLLGNYAFYTRVTNLFPPKSEIRLNVTFFQHRCYINENNDFIAEHIKTDDERNPLNGCIYTLEPGTSLSFPMYFGDESIIISLNSESSPNMNYFISAGAKAKSIPCETLGEPVPGSYLEKVDNDNESFYVGGTWIIKPENQEKPKAWTFTIQKYGPDPETDDVTIGPGTPGYV